MGCDDMGLKLTGVGLILMAAVGLIFVKESELSAHRRQLEGFERMLALFYNEICRLRLPLPQVFAHGSERLDVPYQTLCAAVGRVLALQQDADVPRLWREQLSAHRKLFLLDADEYRQLEEAGVVFCMDNVELKESLFLVYQERVHGLLQSYEDSLSQRRRLNRYGTFLAGIFLIIFLI